MLCTTWLYTLDKNAQTGKGCVSTNRLLKCRRLLCITWLHTTAAPPAAPATALQRVQALMLQHSLPHSPASPQMSASTAQRSLTAQQAPAAMPLQRASCTLPMVGISHRPALKLTTGTPGIRRDPALQRGPGAVTVLTSQLHISCMFLTSMTCGSSSSLGAVRHYICQVRYLVRLLVMCQVRYLIRCQDRFQLKRLIGRVSGSRLQVHQADYQVNQQASQQALKLAASAAQAGQSQSHFPRLPPHSC